MGQGLSTRGYPGAKDHEVTTPKWYYGVRFGGLFSTLLDRGANICQPWRHFEGNWNGAWLFYKILQSQTPKCVKIRGF